MAPCRCQGREPLDPSAALVQRACYLACRDYYSLNELIGGTRGKFTIDQRRFRREDLMLVRILAAPNVAPKLFNPFLAALSTLVIYVMCDSDCAVRADQQARAEAAMQPLQVARPCRAAVRAFSGPALQPMLLKGLPMPVI